MSQAAGTWALVVGIDQYDLRSIPALTSPVADAEAAVAWLRSLNVPDSQIFLCTSPTSTSQPRVDALDLPNKNNARFSAIWGAINNLRGITPANAKRLFIFLSGHGLYVPAKERLFLAQDYGVNDDWSNNLGLESFIGFFRSMHYPEQYLFFDGCQNYSAAETQRGKVSPRQPPVDNWTPKGGNGLTACFAASLDQRALEIGGRSLMLSPLLHELEPIRWQELPAYDQRHNAILYDWHTGERTLDLRQLFDLVRAHVEDIAREQGWRQTPLLESHGLAAAHKNIPILNLPAEPTARLTVDLRPPEALPDVRQLRIRIRMPPRDRCLPPPNPIALPDSCLVPQHAEIELFCILRDGAPWEIKSPSMPAISRIDESQHNLVLELVPVTPAPPPTPTPPPIDLFNVKMLRPDGSPAYVLPGGEASYAPIAQEFDLRMPTETPDPSGNRMTLHEDGPDFAVSQPTEDTRTLMVSWARALRRTAQEKAQTDVNVVLAPPGSTIIESMPNLQFDLSDETARRLGGFLIEKPIVLVDRLDVEGDYYPSWTEQGIYSIATLRDLRTIRADPGRNRIRIEPPWGSWTKVVDIPYKGIIRVDLPEVIGSPPVRNDGPALASEEGFVLVRGDVKEIGWGETSLGPASFKDNPWHVWHTGRVSELSNGRLSTHQAWWVNYGHDGQLQRLVFPVHGNRTLAVDLLGRFPRVEPYSRTNKTEWDLIVSAGRLDAIDKKRLEVLCEEWCSYLPGTRGLNDDLLGVALAYTAFATRSWPDLRKLLDALHYHLAGLVDVDLLELEWHRSLSGTDTGQEVAGRATRKLREGAVPIFRWGVPLGHQLFEERDNPLSAIVSALSPASLWTAWWPAPIKWSGLNARA